ncbi:MAG: BamA/TamA family outer membrane protein [Candidatus Neomarinimicrobiota bacterium]
MKKSILLLPVILITWVNVIVSQSLIITEITVIGHEKTQAYIIQRELQHPVGVPLDSAIAEADRDRLDNLGIFSHVSWDVLPKGSEGLVLRYLLIESWRYLPGASPVYEEGFGWSIDGGILFNNFRGRNESLNIGGQYGARTNFSAFWYNPWMTGDHISLQLGVSKDILQHPFLPYKKATFNTNIKLGRYYGYRWKTRVGIEWEATKFSHEKENIELTSIQPQLQIAYDTRDIYTTPNRGFFIIHSVNAVIHLRSDRPDFWQWDQSYSGYRTLVKSKTPLIGTVNISGQLTFGNPEEIWVQYIGGAFSVRGWKTPSQVIYQGGERDFRFGFQAIHGTLELRQTIIPKFATKFKNEFGVSASAYLDAGFISKEKSDLNNQKTMFGAGIGLQILWPIVQLVRFDYAWAFREGEYVEKAFHIAFGQKF